MKFQKNKGFRSKKGFLWLSPLDSFYLYCPELHNWINELSESPKYSSFSTSYEHCRSLKAAIRKINRANVPKGTTFILSSRFYGCDVELKKY